MHPIRHAVYSAIVLEFLRKISRKSTGPARRFSLPLPTPGEWSEKVTAAIMARCTDGNYRIFRHPDAKAASLSHSQLNALHHEMYSLSMELLSGYADIRVFPWPTRKPIPEPFGHLPEAAGIPREKLKEFISNVDEIVHFFNSAVSR